MVMTWLLYYQTTKAHIKMNTKKLYQADGYAVKELLKVTAVLYNAVKSNTNSYDPSNEESSSMISFDVSSKVGILQNQFQFCLFS